MTYTEAKNEIAGKYDFDTWEQMDKAMIDPDNLFHPLNDYERWQDLHAEATKLYPSEKVKEALQLAAERTNYPYRDEYGCMCDVPAIVLGLETELIKNINKEI